MDNMTQTNPETPDDLLDTLKITRVERRISTNGAWVSGTMGGHRFDALVFSEHAEVQYKCSGHHDPGAERSLAWNDPDLAIDWPLDADPILSAKDAEAPSFGAYLESPDFPPNWDARPSTERSMR